MKINQLKSARQLDWLSAEVDRMQWFDLSARRRQEIQALLAQLMASLVTINKRHEEPHES